MPDLISEQGLLFEGPGRLVVVFRSMRELTRARRFGILTAEDLIEAWRRRAGAPELIETYVRSMLGEVGPPPIGTWDAHSRPPKAGRS